jgi:hypothetical protein
MEIFLPVEIEHYEPELRFFFDLMVRKLHTNRHKQFGEHLTPVSAFELLLVEAEELRVALIKESQFSVAMEAVDVSNFAFLVALVVLRMDKKTFTETMHHVRNGQTADVTLAETGNSAPLGGRPDKPKTDGGGA